MSLAILAGALWLGGLETVEARSRGQGNLYFGGGFLREINSYKFNSTESNFTGWGGASGIAGLEFDNVSSNSTGNRTSFKGLAYHAVGQLTFPAEDRVRTVIEGKFGTGSFDGLTYTESQISLHLYFMPF
jgi:hypothetical protein